MALVIRTSATTAGGSPTATSLGGRPSNASPSASKHGFWDVVTQGQNDAGHTDYRCMFVYNNGSETVNNVKVQISNKGGGSTVNVALCSVAANTHASYNISTIANDTTAPSQVTGGWQASSVTIENLLAGRVRAVWLRRVTTAKTPASTGDTVTLVASGTVEVPPV